MENQPDSNDSSFENVQRNNLALVERMKELATIEADQLVIDIFDSSTVESLKSSTKKELFANSTAEKENREKMLDEVKEKFGCEIEFLENPTVVVAKQRTNLKEFPIPWQMYQNYPYVYSFNSTDEDYLDNGVAVHVNSPAVVLAKTSAKFRDSDGAELEEEFLYVATNTVRGWVKSVDFVNVAPDAILDPLRPSDNLEKIESRGNKLGTVVAYGLKADGDRLVRVNKYSANAQSSESEPSEGSYENMGNGILETGESALTSIGNQLEIVKVEGVDYIVRFPDGREFAVDKDFIKLGYLEPTRENINQLAHEVLDSPYSWGDKDGVNYDCSGFTSSLLGAFGIILARGGIGQMNGLEEKEFLVAERTSEEQDFVEFLPQTITELENKGIDSSVINWGFTTVSWGHHVVLMLGVDESGNIIYIHSVGPQKKVIQNSDSTRKVETVAQFKVVRSTARSTDPNGNLLTYSPYLNGELNKIKMVVHV